MTLELLPEEETSLVAVAQKTGLAPESAVAISSQFQPLFDQAETWRLRVASIRVTDVSQTREMKLARESRLALREIRIEAERVRKALKADSLMRGKAIDGLYNVIEFLVSPLEKQLLEQEQFAERKEQARKDALKATREEQLRPLGVDTSVYVLAEMTDEAFNSLLVSSQIAYQAKVDAARKAEEERIARERADAVERQRIQAENARLKAEADAREKIARAERDKVAKLEQENRKLADAAARNREKLIAHQAKIDAEAAAAAAAPDMEKIASFAKSVESMSRSIPTMTTPRGKALAARIEAKVLELSDWIAELQ
jgi:hypothetical protein